MKPIIKINLQELCKSGKTVIFDLGCGNNKRSGSIGIDQIDLPSVDIVADLENNLSFIPDNCADEVHSTHFLEHIQDFEKIMYEMLRIIKKNGRIFVEVPHFSNPYYYSDPTHKRFFGFYSFYYFVDSKYQLRRKVPTHYAPFKIKVISQKYVFDSPFVLLKAVKKVFQIFINSYSLFQELYEENLCSIIPCSAVKTIFVRADNEKID